MVVVIPESIHSQDSADTRAVGQEDSQTGLKDQPKHQVIVSKEESVILVIIIVCYNNIVEYESV